jgi:hypothetical protein
LLRSELALLDPQAARELGIVTGHLVWRRRIGAAWCALAFSTPPELNSLVDIRGYAWMMR